MPVPGDELPSSLIHVYNHDDDNTTVAICGLDSESKHYDTRDMHVAWHVVSDLQAGASLSAYCPQCLNDFCAHCHDRKHQHAGGTKCLFGPTDFKGI